MTMIATDDLKGTADRLFARKRRMALAVPAMILAYLVFTFFAFDIPGLSERASIDNARALVADTYSYKTHVTRQNRTGEVSVAIEGERKGSYPDGTAPDWVSLGDETVIDLEGGHLVTFGINSVTYNVPGYGMITANPSNSGVELVLPGAEVPDWINASKTRVSITTEAGRLSVTKARSEVFRYFTGWELFFFTLDSPFHGKSFGELTRMVLSDTSTFPAILHDIWHNSMWQHGQVVWALFETVLMAFLGTMGAAMVALPVAFLAARNFTPLRTVRFGIRRVFDFVRGVDGLIWTIILARAFGPGPLTGALAILITDTGSFGKMFSEALENVDEKQIEGVASTGAKPLQRHRFGVIPQVTPIFLSQILYYLESNTRSATIIGAITGGGIGLLLTQAMITQKDWEEVAYYITLIILMVMAMDWFSGWLRRRLIQGDEGGH